ncbi:MAG: hypothetical protein AB7F94_14380 [Nitrospira sp.]
MSTAPIERARIEGYLQSVDDALAVLGMGAQRGVSREEARSRR